MDAVEVGVLGPEVAGGFVGRATVPVGAASVDGVVPLVESANKEMCDQLWNTNLT